MLIYLAAILVLLAGSAFFSGSETAAEGQPPNRDAPR
jgi:Mg2+/Co2+ transporter CorB